MTREMARALSVYRRARLMSFALFAGLCSVLWVLFKVVGPMGVLPVLMLLFIWVLSPRGSSASLLTVWTGYWINSCPYCPLVHVERVEVGVAECVDCGERAAHVRPVMGPKRWSYSLGDDGKEWTCRDCSDLWGESTDE